MANNTSNIKAGSAYVEITARSEALQKGLDAAKHKLQNFGNGLNAIGQKMIMASGGIAAALAAPVMMFSTIGDGIAKAAKRIGATAEETSALAYALELSGTSLKESEAGFTKFNTLLADAANGSKSAQETLAQLGLTAEDFAGKSLVERLELIADKINAIGDINQRNALLKDMFGKSGVNLAPFFMEGAAGIKSMVDEAKKLGLVLSEDDAKKAEQLNDAIGRMMTSFKVIAMRIGSVLAPAVTNLANRIAAATNAVKEFVTEHQEIVIGIALLVPVLAAVGVGLVTAGFTVNALAAAFTVASGIISVAMTVSSTAVAAFKTIAFGEIYLLIAAIGVLLASFAFLAYEILDYFGIIEKALDAFGEAFAFVKNWALESWGAIVNAIKQGDLIAAVNVAWTALKYLWAAGINKLMQYWLEFKGFFVKTGIESFYSFMILANEAYGKILIGWVSLVGELKSYWLAFTFVISDAWDSVFALLAKKWIALKGMFDSSIDVKAEQTKIDTELQDSSQERAQKIVDSEAETRAKKDKIDAETQAVTEAYANDMQAALNDFTDSQTEALQDSQKELDEAWLDWQFAIDEANGTFKAPDAADPERQNEPKKKGRFDDLEKFIDAQNRVNDMARKIESAGTFSADALMRIGGGGTEAERTAKATEEIVTNTKKTNDLLRKNNNAGVFT